jgi:hypothetical protein
MAAKIFFTERQRFKQWWLWLILLGVASVPLYGIIRELQATQPFADPEKNGGIIISLVVLAAVIGLFFLLRLDTKITNDGISVRFFPFHTKSQEYKWQDIAQVYVREYSAISEFGGWGIRYGSGRTGKAYNVSGNHGIQLVFKNGTKILIGTNKLAQAAAALKKTGAVNA